MVLGVASGVAVMALADQDKLETPMLKGLTPQQFVTDSATSGMKEIQMSQLASETSQNNDVRTLAARMVTDHNAINNKLEIIANQEHLAFPATNTFTSSDPLWDNPVVEHPASVKDDYLLTTNLPNLVDYQEFKHLRGMMGREFDLAYVKAVVNDHINIINEFTAASENLTDPQLKKLAADTLPALREHSQMAQKLENQLASQTAGVDNQKAGSLPVASVNTEGK